jgi:hypothetical protein
MGQPLRLQLAQSAFSQSTLLPKLGLSMMVAISAFS